MRDHFNFPKMVDSALRGVVRTALKRVQAEGLRGSHHLYISFMTRFPGVVVADYLRDKYPKEMTIVLQHQFWDLEVGETAFDLTLSFNKVPERLTIPFAALTGFADPSVQFGLQFQAERGKTDGHVPAPAAAGGALVRVESGDPADPDQDDTAEEADGEGGDKVVALDQFRKK